MRSRAIILNNDGQILLGLNKDGKYMLAGGHLKQNEHPVDALLREVKEETNLTKFDQLEYLWPYFDNYVFLLVPENTLNMDCSLDPCHEFESLKWFDLESLPLNMLDSYAEDIIFHFIRCDILPTKEESMKEKNQFGNFVHAGHIDVIVDGEKAFQLDDDTLWQTLPRLAQERSKGRKIEFKQVLDDGTTVDHRVVPMPNKDDLESKEKTVAWVKKNPECCCLCEDDISFYNNNLILDLSSELLNPSVQILKMADTFDNSLLFDGRDEFWITNQFKPVWRSNYANRYASYEEMVEIWNIKFPKHSITLDWFKGILEKLFENKKPTDKKKVKKPIKK